MGELRAYARAAGRQVPVGGRPTGRRSWSSWSATSAARCSTWSPCSCCSGRPRRSGGFTLAEALLMTGLTAAGFVLADFDRRQHRPAARPTCGPARWTPCWSGRSACCPSCCSWTCRCARLLRLVFGRDRVRGGAGRLNDIDWTPGRVLLVVVAPIAGGGVLRGDLRADRQPGVLVGRLGRGRQRASPTAGATSPRTRSRSTAAGSARVFAYGLGFGFVAYQPALALLGRADPLGLPAWAGYTSPLVALRRGALSPPSCGAPASGTTGARAHDVIEMHGPAQRLHGTGESRPAAPDETHGGRRGRGRPDHRAGGDGRLHRPERRRQVDHAEDADRRADAVRRRGRRCAG